MSVTRRISIRGLAGIAAFSASLLLPLSSHGQQLDAPQWVNDGWRSSKYPQSEWFVGFSQDGVKAGLSTASAIQRVEQDARNKMAESITSRLTSASRNETFSSRVVTGTQSREVVEKNYGQIIQSSTSAAVAKTELYSWRDAEKNRVYAFAAVRRPALADYYAGMIESGLTEAERGLELAKQAVELGKKKDAVDKLAESKRKIESLGYYGDLLIAADPQKGLDRAQGDRVTGLLKRIAAALVEAESVMAVYVTGREIIMGASADIILPALQTLINDNGGRVTEDKEEAGYILKFEAEACNVKPPASTSFYFSESCVKVTLTNVKTGKAEVTATVTGPKKSGNSAHEAGEAAFKEAAPKIWDKISGKVLANK